MISSIRWLRVRRRRSSAALPKIARAARTSSRRCGRSNGFAHTVHGGRTPTGREFVQCLLHLVFVTGVVLGGIQRVIARENGFEQGLFEAVPAPGSDTAFNNVVRLRFSDSPMRMTSRERRLLPITSVARCRPPSIRGTSR
jgi:hypothetical protein